MFLADQRGGVHASSLMDGEQYETCAHRIGQRIKPQGFSLRYLNYRRPWISDGGYGYDTASMIGIISVEG